MLQNSRASPILPLHGKGTACYCLIPFGFYREKAGHSGALLNFQGSFGEYISFVSCSIVFAVPFQIKTLVELNPQALCPHGMSLRHTQETTDSYLFLFNKPYTTRAHPGTLGTLALSLIDGQHY